MKILPTQVKHSSENHGKNGVGRLSFFIFANKASWTTVFNEGDKNFSYQITIESNSLHKYQEDIEFLETNQNIGTEVQFSDFIILSNSGYNKIESDLRNHLIKEFGWYLELKVLNTHKIVINGKPLDYSQNIKDREFFQFKDNSSSSTFDIKYIQWRDPINSEYSQFYYLDENYTELYKETTKLNKRGDNFYHTLYISSEYFNGFIFEEIENSEQRPLIYGNRTDKLFLELEEFVYSYLREKRRPFLKYTSQRIIKELESEGILEKKGKTGFELIKAEDLEEVIQTLYITEPKIFTKLNKEQKRTFIGLLNLVLDSDAREQILDILEKIVNLTAEERDNLHRILRVTELTYIVNTIKLISDRFAVLELFKELVFNELLDANEVNHLQNVVENQFWIFGEEYSLVAAAEDTFETALRKHIKILSEKDEEVKINHIHKNKQVDIFLCRQMKTSKSVHNIIVEIKHPQKHIGEAQLSQVKRYMRTIQDISRFNADMYSWDFFLIGTKFDDSGFIEDELKNKEKSDLLGLVHEDENKRVFVIKWSDLIPMCEIRHDFLNKKLEVRKSNLNMKMENREDVEELIGIINAE